MYSLDIGNSLKKAKDNFIFFLIFILFFGYLFVSGEPIYVYDTIQYEHQMIMCEPVYSLLIQFCRFISPKYQFWIIILIQNMLAVIANTIFIAFLRKHFNLNMWWSLLFTGIVLMPHIMTPMFSSTDLILTNALMTEGILFSIYLLAFISLLDMVWSGNPVCAKSFRTLILFWFMTLIRGQMMVLIVVWFLAAYVLVVKNGIKKTRQAEDEQDTFRLAENIAKQGLIIILAAFVVAFVARSITIRVYNYCENGLFVDKVSGKAMSLANVLYVAEKNDGEAIENDDLRQLFYEIYDEADANKMNYKYAPSGILAKAAYHEKCHDSLHFIYFIDPAKRYVGKTENIYVEDYQNLMIALDDIAGELSSELMPEVIKQYLSNYICMIVLGFIRSIAYEKTFLAWYALFAYIAVIIMTIILWKKKQKSMAVSFMALVLISIIGNACATALMVQCLSRYMIYNLPLFYIAAILEARELLSIYIKQTDEG